MENVEVIENPELRAKLVGRVEVLDKVKGLIMLPNNELATIEQVANFYRVSEATIRRCVQRNREELELDGSKLMSRTEFLEVLKFNIVTLENDRGVTNLEFNNGDTLNISNVGRRVFTKRAVLRIGMLLKGSKVAEKIRSHLRNIEVWKDVSGYEGLYQVSNFGRVKSLSRTTSDGRGISEKILKTNVQNNGYVYVKLSKNSKQIHTLVHRLVATHFVPNPDDKEQVNHKNGNKTDNHMNNLDWVTSGENQQHAVENGLHKSGHESHLAKLSKEQVEYIKSVYVPRSKEFGGVALSKKFGVHKGTISKIVKGKTHKAHRMY